MVIYPEAVWYGGVKAEDASEIISAMLEGHTIERLSWAS
jgi:(2Fe-2S) ferredoxin